MGIQLSTNFDLSSQIPLDSRAIVATTGEMNAFVVNNKAYAGLTVYVTGENKYYYYNTSNQWVVLNNFPGENVVYTTGNQTISGIKTFATRPQVNGTGILLQGEIPSLPNTLVYTTGNQTISGEKKYAENATFLDESVFQKESTFYDRLTLTNRNWSNTYSISGSGVNDQIGKTVYLNKDGNVLIASSSPSGSSVGGPVYIYTGFNNTWNLKQTITGNSFNSSLVGDRFEMSSDNTVLCISFENFGNKLHIFTGSRNLGWNFKQTITGNYTFGHRFAMDDNGETIAVSTYRFGGGIGETGKVDIFTGSKNTTWNLKQSFTGEGLNQLFGSSVSLSKDAKVLAIGAVFSGRAYTYVGNPIDGWLPQQIFTTNAIQQPAIGFGQFGSKLLLNNSGTVLIISHSNEDNYRGALYFYTGSNTNSWNLVDKVIGFTGFDLLGVSEGLVSNSDASIVVPTAPGYNGIGGHYSLILQKSIIENRWFIQQKIDTNQDLRVNTASTINSDASIIAFSSPFFNYNNSPFRYGNGLIQLYTDVNPNSFSLGNIYPEDFARIDGSLKIVGNLNLTGNLNINGNFNTNVTPTVNNSGLALLDRSVQTDSDARIVSLRFTQTGDNGDYSEPAPRIRTKFVSGGYDRIQVTHGLFSNRQILEVWESGVILNHRPTVNGTGVLLSGETTLPFVNINNITTNFGFNDSYNSKLLTINASQNITGTVPTGLSTGYNVSFAQIGTGKLFITGSGGAIVRQRLNLYNTAGQYAVASLVHYSGNQYLLYGDLN